MFRNERFESRSRLQVAIWWIMQSCVQICPYRWAAELASRRNTEAENVDQLVYGLECVEKGSEKNLLPRHAGAAEGCWVPGCRAGTDVASGRERCSARKRPHLQAVALQRRSGGSPQSLAEPAGAPLASFFIVMPCCFIEHGPSPTHPARGRRGAFGAHPARGVGLRGMCTREPTSPFSFLVAFLQVFYVALPTKQGPFAACFRRPCRPRLRSDKPWSAAQTVSRRFCLTFP